MSHYLVFKKGGISNPIGNLYVFRKLQQITTAPHGMATQVQVEAGGGWLLLHHKMHFFALSGGMTVRFSFVNKLEIADG